MGDRGRNRSFEKPPSTLRSFLEMILHKIDLFARPITLTYAQDSEFKSNMGGIWTIFVGMILITLFALEVNTLYTKSDSIYSSSMNLEDLISDKTQLNLGSDKNFNFAFSLVVSGVDLIADGTYAQASLDLVTQTRTTTNGSSKTTSTTKSIPFAKCGTAFDSIDKSVATQIGISDFYWPTSTDYYIKGTYYSDEFTYIQLSFKRWTTGSCKTDSEITSKLTNARVQMAVTNSFVDFSDYAHPLKHNIYDNNYWDLVPGYFKKGDIYVQRNYGKFQDGVLVYDDQTSDYFYQIFNTQDRFLQESTDTSNL